MEHVEPDAFFAALTAPLEAVQAAPPRSKRVVEAPVAVAVQGEEAVVAATPDGMFSTSDGQIGFIDSPVSERQYATLKALQTLVGEPYPVKYGDRFRICGKHFYAVESIIEPPFTWQYLLDGNISFLPWPDILAADFFAYECSPVVMVQPDVVIAGMTIALYAHRYGNEAVVKV